MKILLFVLTLVFSQLAAAEVVVIVNLKNNTDIYESDIKRIFLGKMKNFADGSIVTPYYLAEGHAVRDKFNEKALEKSSKQLNAYWSKSIFTGKGMPPDAFDNVADALAAVSSDANAIAYIDAADVTDAVKVVARFP